MNRTDTLIDNAEIWRKANDYTVAEFAKRLGIHESLWYKVRLGSRQPSIALIVKLSQLSESMHRLAEYVAPSYVQQKPPETPQKEQGRFRSAFQVVRGWWQSMRGR